MKFDALFNSINEQWTVSDLVSGPEWNMKGKDAPFKPVTKAQKASRTAGPKLGAVGAMISNAAKKQQAKLAKLPTDQQMKDSKARFLHHKSTGWKNEIPDLKSLDKLTLPESKSTIKQIFKEYTSNWLNENTNEGPDLRLIADLAKQNQTDTADRLW